MKKDSTPHIRRVKITDEIRKAYERRDKSKDNLDPESPVLPPEMWENAVIGKYYRAIKTPVSVRIDNDVLEWLKSDGPGYQSRINEILRREMNEGRKKAS